MKQPVDLYRAPRHSYSQIMRIHRLKRPSGLVLLAAALGISVPLGCQTPGAVLEQSTDRARDALEVIRPDAKVGDVRVVLWTRSMAPPAEAGNREILSGRRVAGILDTWSGPFLALRITSPGAVAGLRKEFARFDSFAIRGVALPSRSEVLVKAPSVELVAHELAHVASARLGYPARWRTAVFGSGNKESTKWIDLDALIGVWSRSEGEAVVTGKAAVAFDEGGLQAVDTALEAVPPPNLEDAGNAMTGPLRITYADGAETRVAAGQKRIDPRSIGGTLTYLAYHAAPALLARSWSPGETLATTIRRWWMKNPPSASPLLGFPRPRAAGRMLEGNRAAFARIGVKAVARLGPLFVYQAGHMAHLDLPGALAHARALRDDVLLTGSGGTLWILRFEDAPSAEGFAGDYEKAAGGDLHVARRGSLVIASAGAPRFRDAALRLLGE